MEEELRFPLFVDLRGKKVVVVGGGAIACRRAGVLLSFGAAVTVIAPVLNEHTEAVTWVERPYAPGDLAGATLAVAATDQRDVNRAVGEEARGLPIPVSVADAPGECTFYFPAICRGGGLTAGLVSVDGDHARTARAARAVRRTLEDLR